MPGPSGSPFSPPGGYGPGNTITITLANRKTVLGRFKQHQAGLEANVDRITEELARSIAEAARDLVPVDTSRTQKSIRVERRGKAYHATVVDRLGERDEVPIYLEIGTYKMAARPFLVPAMDLVLSAGGLSRAVGEVGGLIGPMRATGFSLTGDNG